MEMGRGGAEGGEEWDREGELELGAIVAGCEDK